MCMITPIEIDCCCFFFEGPTGHFGSLRGPKSLNSPESANARRSPSWGHEHWAAWGSQSGGPDRTHPPPRARGNGTSRDAPVTLATRRVIGAARVDRSPGVWLMRGSDVSIYGAAWNSRVTGEGCSVYCGRMKVMDFLWCMFIEIVQWVNDTKRAASMAMNNFIILKYWCDNCMRGCARLRCFFFYWCNSGSWGIPGQIDQKFLKITPSYFKIWNLVFRVVWYAEDDCANLRPQQATVNDL